MIVVLTETPDEVAHSLKSYFLINNHYTILTVEHEIDEFLDNWISDYDGHTDEELNKIVFNSPFLVITKNSEIINSLYNDFVFDFLHEIEDVNNVMNVFVSHGFLPLDISTIREYIQSTMTDIDSDMDKVLALFKQLGYIDANYAPTEKLILSLYESEETQRYSNLLMLVASNNDIDTTDSKFKSFLFEILKYIDFNIYLAILSPQDIDDNDVYIH